MSIFEITKTNTLLPQKGLAPILIAPPHTYVAYATQATISSVKQSKTNVTPCLHRTRAARQNIIEVIIISDAVYTGCCAARQISDRKLLPRSIYEVLTQIWNDFQRSLYRDECRQTLAVAVWCVRCRTAVKPAATPKCMVNLAAALFCCVRIYCALRRSSAGLSDAFTQPFFFFLVLNLYIQTRTGK